MSVHVNHFADGWNKIGHLESPSLEGVKKISMNFTIKVKEDAVNAWISASLQLYVLSLVFTLETTANLKTTKLDSSPLDAFASRVRVTSVPEGVLAPGVMVNVAFARSPVVTVSLSGQKKRHMFNIHPTGSQKCAADGGVGYSYRQHVSEQLVYRKLT